MQTTGKIALVTGASRGLGKDTALNLARKGIDLVITYNKNAALAQDVVNTIEAHGQKAVALPLDSSNTDRFDEFALLLGKTLEENWGRTQFDFLINNAGTNGTAPFAETSEAQFDSLMNIHFKGVFFLTQRLLPLIANNGRIINLSSGLARFCVPGYSAYAAMKGAIEVFTRYLAKELGSRGIAANVVAPGAIDTDFNKAGFAARPEIRGFLASQTALGRVGEAEDIGALIAFLCTDDARWVNAQRIEASGGMFL